MVIVVEVYYSSQSHIDLEILVNFYLLGRFGSFEVDGLLEIGFDFDTGLFACNFDSGNFLVQVRNLVVVDNYFVQVCNLVVDDNYFMQVCNLVVVDNYFVHVRYVVVVDNYFMQVRNLVVVDNYLV